MLVYKIICLTNVTWHWPAHELRSFACACIGMKSGLKGLWEYFVIHFMRKEKGEWMRDSWIINHMSILCISLILTARDCYCYRINWPFSKWAWSPSYCLWCSGLLAQAQEVCIFLTPKSCPGIESSRVLILALASTWFLNTLNFSQK